MNRDIAPLVELVTLLAKIDARVNAKKETDNEDLHRQAHA